MFENLQNLLAFRWDGRISHSNFLITKLSMIEFESNFFYKYMNV